MSEFDGLGMHLGNLARLSTAETRSVSADPPGVETGPHLAKMTNLVMAEVPMVEHA